MGRDRVAIYASARDRREPLVVIRFAQRSRGVRAPPEAYRNPGATDPPVATDRPLAGLRVAIEPADIGGVWAAMEDRSVDFPGYGQMPPRMDPVWAPTVGASRRMSIQPVASEGAVLLATS